MPVDKRKCWWCPFLPVYVLMCVFVCWRVLEPWFQSCGVCAAGRPFPLPPRTECRPIQSSLWFSTAAGPNAPPPGHVTPPRHDIITHWLYVIIEKNGLLKEVNDVLRWKNDHKWRLKGLMLEINVFYQDFKLLGIKRLCKRFIYASGT